MNDRLKYKPGLLNRYMLDPIANVELPPGSTFGVVEVYQYPVLGVELVDPNAILPTKAHPSDSGFDLYACKDAIIFGTGEGANIYNYNHIVPHSHITMVPIGIRFAIPDGFEIQIRPRSGLSKKGIMCTFSTIDQNYRGLLYASLYNISNQCRYYINKGDKVAQAVLCPVQKSHLVECKVDLDTDRSDKGFGSTDGPKDISE